MSYKFTTGSVRRGDVYFEDDRTGAATYIDFGQDTITLRPSGSQILYAQHNRVGIGTTSPDYTLDVAGDIGVDQYIYHNGDANTHINFADDKIVLKAGNIAMVTMEEKASAPHEVTINDGSNNIDFVVKGNGSRGGNPGMKFDASTNKVGINGVGTPEESLHVDGNIKVFGDDPRIKINADTDSHPGVELYENGTRKWIAYNNYTNDNLTFKTDSDIIMSLTQTGRVGIGTTEPQSELHVNGTTLFSSSANQELIRVAKADGDTREITFENEGVDIGSIYFNSAEHMFIRQENGAKDLAFRIASTNAIRIDGSTSRVGIFEDSPATTLDVNGSFRVQSDSIAIQNSKTPANASDTGQAGQICWDTNYLYVCVASNTWKRIALSSW